MSLQLLWIFGEGDLFKPNYITGYSETQLKEAGGSLEPMGFKPSWETE